MCIRDSTHGCSRTHTKKHRSSLSRREKFVAWLLYRGYQFFDGAMPNVFLCTQSWIYVPATGLFLALSAMRGAGGPPLHDGADLDTSWGSGCVFSAFKAEESWLCLRDRFPPSKTQAEQWTSNNLSFLFCCWCIMYISHGLSKPSSPLCGSRGTTVVAPQVLPPVTATDGASMCTCGCFVSCRP